MRKILFILKERFYSSSKSSYGLINSATHLANYLETVGNNCKVVTVFDGNFIDKEVSEYKPNIVILEAIWCPTYKLKELMELKKYRGIQWVVRVHSDMGFLSCETQALKTLREYVELHKDNLTISLNSYSFTESLSNVMKYDFTYLPNIVPVYKGNDDILKDCQHIDIGCFGAPRLLKNQCFQAMCAILAADKLDKKLRFHITVGPNTEKNPVLANLKELFENNRHELIIHEWLPNDEFQKLIAKMDLGLQVSYTESFNIVTSDFINNNRLIIVSDAISWMPSLFKVSTTDYNEVVDRILYIYSHKNSYLLKNLGRNALIEYNQDAKAEWKDFLCDCNSGKKHGKDKNKGRKQR
jgi:hypothetical protein